MSRGSQSTIMWSLSNRHLRLAALSCAVSGLIVFVVMMVLVEASTPGPLGHTVIFRKGGKYFLAERGPGDRIIRQVSEELYFRVRLYEIIAQLAFLFGFSGFGIVIGLKLFGDDGGLKRRK